MARCLVRFVMLVTLAAGAVLPASSQTNSDLQSYFSKSIGLSQDQITAIRNGQPVAKLLNSRTPAEIYVFGAVYINATPASYVQFAYDFNRLSKQPGFLAVREFSSPPQLSDLNGFTLDSQDIQSLKSCKPGSCRIQLPANVMQELHSSINWSASNVDDQVNQFIQKLAVQRLQLYQQQGNKILGAVYNDKKQPTTVAVQFKYILSYPEVLPQWVPDFYNYLLTYPESQPANVENMFYWDNVKFGLKPTLRMVHVVTMRGTGPSQPAYAIAEKQLYSSHYFETALDLTFCVSGSGNPTQPGFYLIQILGSEQAGLTGFKGSIVRKVAVGKAVSAEQTALTQFKSALEHK